MNAILHTLAALIVVAAFVRGGMLLRFAVSDHSVDPGPRQLLRLPPDHRVRGLIASGKLAHSAGVLWWSDAATATAILPDAHGRLRIGYPEVDADQFEPESLAQLDPSQWPELPPQWQRLTVYHWDATATVYVTAGPDGLPGITGIDDDGNGSVDDLAELGATGSDDFVTAPGQSGYELAAAGQMLARPINRGALVPLDSTLQRPAHRRSGANEASAEVWLEFTGDSDTPPRRIVLHSPN